MKDLENCASYASKMDAINCHLQSGGELITLDLSIVGEIQANDQKEADDMSVKKSGRSES